MNFRIRYSSAWNKGILATSRMRLVDELLEVLLSSESLVHSQMINHIVPVEVLILILLFLDNCPVQLSTLWIEMTGDGWIVVTPIFRSRSILSEIPLKSPTPSLSVS